MQGIRQDQVLDHVNIERVQASYADIVTRRDWGALRDVFLPDATVTVDRRQGTPLVLTGPVELGEFIATSISVFEFFEFVILNSVIALDDRDPTRAQGTMYIAELRQDAATGRRTTAFGVYRDVYAGHDGAWWFAARRYRSAARTSPGELAVFGFADRAGDDPGLR